MRVFQRLHLPKKPPGGVLRSHHAPNPSILQTLLTVQLERSRCQSCIASSETRHHSKSHRPPPFRPKSPNQEMTPFQSSRFLEVVLYDTGRRSSDGLWKILSPGVRKYMIIRLVREEAIISELGSKSLLGGLRLVDEGARISVAIISTFSWMFEG